MDVELGLCDYFEDIAYTVTSTPIDLTQRVKEKSGVLRIRRIGGPGDGDSDNPTVSIQAYAGADSTHPRAAHDLQQLVEDRFIRVMTYGPEMAGTFLVEDPSKTSGPVELPYPNAAINVVESIYKLNIRR